MVRNAAVSSGSYARTWRFLSLPFPYDTAAIFFLVVMRRREGKDKDRIMIVTAGRMKKI